MHFTPTAGATALINHCRVNKILIISEECTLQNYDMFISHAAVGYFGLIFCHVRWNERALFALTRHRKALALADNRTRDLELGSAMSSVKPPLRVIREGDLNELNDSTPDAEQKEQFTTISAYLKQIFVFLSAATACKAFSVIL